MGGTIDCIASDHSPSTLELKDPEHGDFRAAWGGVSSLQLGLALIWTETRIRGIGLDQAHWMAAAPAALAGLASKGAIPAGTDADFAVFAAEESFTVDPAALGTQEHDHALRRKAATGVVRRTLPAGTEVDPGGPLGRLLSRGEA